MRIVLIVGLVCYFGSVAAAVVYDSRLPVALEYLSTEAIYRLDRSVCNTNFGKSVDEPHSDHALIIV